MRCSYAGLRGGCGAVRSDHPKASLLSGPNDLPAHLENGCLVSMLNDMRTWDEDPSCWYAFGCLSLCLIV